MITEKNVKEIEEAIDNIYQKIITKPVHKIISWQWLNLFFYLIIIITLFISIFSFIVTYDSHFLMNKTVFLPLAISFLVLFIISLITIIIIKKGQKQLCEKIKINFNYQLLTNLYSIILANQNDNTVINEISTKWTICPINEPQINDFKINDAILIGKYQNNDFNIGSISQATTTVLDNLQPNYIPKPYNLQYYRYLFLTITNNKLKTISLELNRKNNYEKDNLEFNNFFYYQETPTINATVKTQIIKNMVKTNLIPNIKINNGILSFQLATISTNSWTDNYDSFVNLNINLNKNIMIDNIFEMINHDITTLQKSFVWLNLLTVIN